MARRSILFLVIAALLGTALHAASLDWPRRVAITNSPLVGVEGEAPADLGRFGECRVFDLGVEEDGRRFLLITEYRHERENRQVVSVPHARGVCRVSMRRHNGSTAVFRPSPKRAARGVFIYLSGIIGMTPPEQTLVDTFRAAGWHTLVSETSFNFMQRRTVLIDPDNIVPTARKLGRDANDHLADKAYAVEAMLKVIAKRYPELRMRPRVLTGGSAGAVAVPTVAARIGRSEAVILVGAGGNVGRILCESTLEPITLYQHVREDGHLFRRRLSDVDRRRVGGEIYRHTPLDPLRLGAALRGRPILMVRGELDRMVPSATNDLLWEALDQPVRWTLPVNHLMLFGMLQFQSATILDWAEQAIAEGRAKP